MSITLSTKSLLIKGMSVPWHCSILNISTIIIYISLVSQSTQCKCFCCICWEQKKQSFEHLIYGIFFCVHCIHIHARTHARTHILPFNGHLSRTTRRGGTKKFKSIWILLKQETVSGSGISWAICTSAPRSRQITTPAAQGFYRPHAYTS